MSIATFGASLFSLAVSSNMTESSAIEALSWRRDELSDGEFEVINVDELWEDGTTNHELHTRGRNQYTIYTFLQSFNLHDFKTD